MLMHYKSCLRIFCVLFCGLFDLFSKVHVLKKTNKTEALIWTLITTAVLEALMHLGQQH